MTKILDATYPGQTTPGNADYPGGAGVNVTAPGAGDGTPLDQAWFNDIQALIQALVTQSGQTLDDAQDTVLNSQVLKGLVDFIGSADFYTDGGVADAYSLAALGDRASPAVYSEGLRVRFIAGNSNTGASTLSLPGLSNEALQLNGAALTGGEIIAGARVQAEYTSGAFEIITGGSTVVNDQTGTTYTLALSDAGGYVRLANAGAVALTVPVSTSINFEIGAVVYIAQTGAGQVTVSPDVGVTINKKASVNAITAEQYAVVALRKVAVDTWDLYGELDVI